LLALRGNTFTLTYTVGFGAFSFLLRHLCCVSIQIFIHTDVHVAKHEIDCNHNDNINNNHNDDQ